MTSADLRLSSAWGDEETAGFDQPLLQAGKFHSLHHRVPVREIGTDRPARRCALVAN